MQIDRRELLKGFRSSALATAVSAGVTDSAFAQTADVHNQAATPLLQGLIENPERLLDSEPVVTVSPEGDATINWKTVVPTQGATIYLGLPNDEIALDWPIYSASQAFTEEKPQLDHEATIDLRGYINRNAARMMVDGGVFFYRIELYDPRRAAVRFIDRHFVAANDRAPREFDFSRHRAVLARSRERNGWRRLLHAQKENKVPQANCGHYRRQLRVTELDFRFSCTECTENGGRTSRAGFSESVCNMRNQRERP